MKIDIKSPRLYLFSSMLAALPAIPLQLMAYLKAYDSTQTNYFFTNSPLPAIATAFSILSCLLAIVAIVLWKKDSISLNPPSGSLASFPAALGFLVGGVVMLLSNTEKLTYILPILCFLAAIYNGAIIFAGDRARTIVALIGFSAVIACILFNGYYYFDASLEMNAPLKVSTQMAFLAVMIYFISEIRFLLDIELPLVSLLACAFTVGVGALVAIPVPVAYLLGVFKPQGAVFTASLTAQIFDHPEYLAGAAVVLGASISSAWKLCHAMTAKNGKEDA